MKWVGHTNLKVTAGYSHFPDDYQQEIVNKLK